MARPCRPVWDRLRHGPVIDRQEDLVASSLFPARASPGRIAVGVDGSLHPQEALCWAIGQPRAPASRNGDEVTVATSDGPTVDVHLDQSFDVDDHGRPGG